MLVFKCKIISVTISIFLFLQLPACAFHTQPENNSEYYYISELAELDGVYRNKGNPSGYLSILVLGDLPTITDGKIQHESIDLIDVSVTGTSINVKAVKANCSVYEKNYIAGQDFDVGDGKITLRRKFNLITRGGDDPLLGPSYEEITLGIDQEKQGKSTNVSYAAGLVFAIVPIAASATTEVRYERLENKHGEYPPCGAD